MGGTCTQLSTLCFSARNHDLEELSLPTGYRVFSSLDPEQGILQVPPVQSKRQGNISFKPQLWLVT